jgi:hypothetical protein
MPHASPQRGYHGAITCSVVCRNERSRIRSRETALARFNAKVRRTDSCWIWTGAHTTGGYGNFYFDGRVQHAHRASWQLFRGPISNGLWALHNCPSGDNPACVNPDHLFLGTHDENMMDMSSKGRSGAITHPERFPRGSTHHSSKLTESQVIAIRSRYTTGQVTQTALAQEYGVSTVLIGLIVRHKSWKHLP